VHNEKAIMVFTLSNLAAGSQLTAGGFCKINGAVRRRGNISLSALFENV
jgi:hypothetical protein